MSNEPSTKSTGSADATAVELPFQAEVQQVLALVINSLYTHKEVFLRELISNASDALDKARFLALTQQGREPSRSGERRASRSSSTTTARTLTIEDNGVGMTRDEVIQNLGTIARSGSLEFFKAYADARQEQGRRGCSSSASSASASTRPSWSPRASTCTRARCCPARSR